MKGNKMSGGLTLRWFPVVDARGRKHMEARWLDTSPRVPQRHQAA